MLNIAIDGHVGSGKSTLAKGLAKKLGIHVFDTGAVYRALACEFMSQNLGDPNEKLVKEFAKDLKVEVRFVDDVQYVLVNGNDYSGQLRLEQTSVMSGKISPFKILREKVKTLQQDFAKTHDVVMEGRDIGTEILPNADFKFFVTADEMVRAKRRYLQVKDKPNPPSFENILKDLRERDFRDENRAVSPLKPAPDSIIIDNSDKSLEQTVDQCLKIIKNKKA